MSDDATDAARYRFLRSLFLEVKWRDAGPLEELRPDIDDPSKKYISAADLDEAIDNARVDPPANGRDPKRIDVVLAVIRETWLRQPDTRLGQLLVNHAPPLFKGDLFYVEDDRWLAAFSEVASHAV